MSVLGRRMREGRRLLQDMSRERNIDMQSILGRYNYRYLTEVRREFCVRAKDLGLGATLIGRILQRNHTTVLYHQRPEMRAAKAKYLKDRRARL